MTKDLGDDVQKETRRRGIGIKGFIAGAILGVAVGGYFGAKQELKNDRLYEHSIRQGIKDAALEGYAWKEGADPKFYEMGRPALILNEETMTMQGHAYKLVMNDTTGMVEDTIDYGPIMPDRIGYPPEVRIKREVDEKVRGVKEWFRDFSEKAEDKYQEIDGKAREKFNDTFRKEREQDTVYQTR